jgi:hypothetical protein
LIEDYFRPDRTEKELLGRYTFGGSHHTFTKKFAEFANRRKIKLPQDFLDLAKGLQESVSDFRDDHIAHKHNMRSGHGTMFLLDGSAPPRIMKHLLYPNERELGVQQVESMPLNKLMDLLESYFNTLCTLIVTNRNYSSYMRQRHG